MDDNDIQIVRGLLCLRCNKLFDNRRLLREHVQLCSKICKLCGVLTNGGDDLVNHHAIIHAPPIIDLASDSEVENEVEEAEEEHGPPAPPDDRQMQWDRVVNTEPQGDSVPVVDLFSSSSSSSSPLQLCNDETFSENEDEDEGEVSQEANNENKGEAEENKDEERRIVSYRRESTSPTPKKKFIRKTIVWDR